MACTGCALICDFVPTGNPFLWVTWGFVPQPPTNPNGACVENPDGGCTETPCLPTGYIGILNITQATLTIRWRTTPTGAWTDTPVALGQGVPIEVGGWQIACGDSHVMAEVWNGTTKLGEVTLGCSKCEHET